MANTKSILRKISADTQHQELEHERLQQNYEQIRQNDDQMEEERNKDETTKIHERYRRKQKNTENGMSLDHLIRPTKNIAEKPGTYFYGPLKKLAEDFGDISTMLRHMTLGQNQKYSQDGDRLLNRSGKVVYDEQAKECFE